jgi:hypothetical protein
MKMSGDRKPGRRIGHTGPPPGRLSKGQEAALFVAMLLVLLALIAYGLRA